MWSPDRQALLQQRVSALHRELDSVRLLYTYHYSLRSRSAWCVSRQAHEPTDTTGSVSYSHNDTMTLTEHKIAQLTREIKACETQLESARRDAEKTKHAERVVGVMMPPGNYTVQRGYLYATPQASAAKQEFSRMGVEQHILL